MKDWMNILLLFVIMTIVGATCYVWGNEWGYHEGIIDGKRSTMLTNYTVEPCEVIFEIRGEN